ncbi:hypothetical protein HRbin33_00975 [bacterium HR33]|nr:hypothetical protein HRbin33_00975 [bacterium HR33]
MSSEKAREFLANIYPEHEADLFLDMATSGAPVATLRLSASGTRSSHHSAAFGNWLQEQGFCYELRAVFSVRGVLWGTGCWMRGGRGRAFDEREVRLLRRAVPHVARALRAAALKEATQNGSALDSPGDDPLIGVLATSTDDRIVFGNLPAQRYLADLARHDRWDFSDSRLPWVLSLVLGRVSHLHRGKARGEGARTRSSWL